MDKEDREPQASSATACTGEAWCIYTQVSPDMLPASVELNVSSSNSYSLADIVLGTTQLTLPWMEPPALLLSALSQLPALRSLSLTAVPSNVSALQGVAAAVQQLPTGAELELAFDDSHAGQLSHDVVQALAALPSLHSLCCSLGHHAHLEPLCNGAATALTALSLALNGPAFHPNGSSEHLPMELARRLGRLPTCLTDLQLPWHPQLDQLMHQALLMAASTQPDSALQALWNAEHKYVHCLESKHLKQLSSLVCLKRMSLAYDALGDRVQQQRQEEQQEQAQLRLEQQQEKQRQQLHDHQQEQQQQDQDQQRGHGHDKESGPQQQNEKRKLSWRRQKAFELAQEQLRKRQLLDQQEQARQQQRHRGARLQLAGWFWPALETLRLAAVPQDFAMALAVFMARAPRLHSVQLFTLLEAADVDSNWAVRPEAPSDADMAAVAKLLSPNQRNCLNPDCIDPDQALDDAHTTLDVTLQLPSICPESFDGRLVLGSTPGLRALDVVGACCQSGSLVWLQGALWNPSLTSLRWVGQVAHPESECWEGDPWGEHGVCAHALEAGWRWALESHGPLALSRLELNLAGDASDEAMVLVFGDAAACALAAVAPGLEVLALAVVDDSGLSFEGKEALLQGCVGLRAAGFIVNYVQHTRCGTEWNADKVAAAESGVLCMFQERTDTT